MLQANDLRGLYAIIPTPSRPGASEWDAVDTVDIAETVRVVNALIADGVDGLIALGTTGEAATITNDEYDLFVDTLLATVAGRVPTFVGTTALGLHEVVRRTRFAKDRGADGILLGLPMWQPCTTEMATRYYQSVSTAFPDLAIMVYANARAFRFNFSDPGFWQNLITVAPTVMSAKFSRPASLLPLLAVTNGRVHFLPHDDAVFTFFGLSPGTTTACWATAASMGPEPSRAIMDAILSGDVDRAKSIAADIAWTNEPVKPITSDPELFASYNIQLEKTRITSAGYCNAGPLRPPYDVFPEPYLSQAQEVGARWKQIRAKYTKSAAR